MSFREPAGHQPRSHPHTPHPEVLNGYVRGQPGGPSRVVHPPPTFRYRAGVARLVDFASNVTSQNGEDGMIARLIADLGLQPGLCAEFGAWDGKHLSNTWALWARQNWSAILIEADSRRFAVLEENTSEFDVTCINAVVGFDIHSSLDTLVHAHRPHEEVQLLCIDIDGDDYWVWSGTSLRPAIVVIEYNASFAPETDFVQEPDDYIGSSAAALMRLGRTKEYTLVDLTETNLLFVRDDLAHHLTVDSRDLTELFDRRWVPVVYSDLHGVHHLTRPAQWGFAGVRVAFSKQRISGRLRHFVVAPAKHLAQSRRSPVGSLIRRLEDLYVTRRSRRPAS